MAKGTKISSAIVGPFILSTSDNPLTITSTGAITSTGTGNAGIDGDASTAWIIRNKGAVSSAGGWGINLAGAGSLDNSGVISGLLGGFLTGGAGRVTNKGTISGGVGVELRAGGEVTNNKGASISGGAAPLQAGAGVLVRGGAGEITNKGTIRGGSASEPGGSGIDLEAGGKVTNNAGASISGGGGGFMSGGAGVLIRGGAGEVTNKGTISSGGRFSDGIDLAAGGSVTNNRDASISGGGVNGGVGVSISGGAGQVKNKGTISGAGGNIGGAGIDLAAGGSVTNDAGGSISAGSTLVGPGAAGVLIGGSAGEVTNEGTISGGSFSVFLGGRGVGGAGVDLSAGGSVTNNGMISGGDSSNGIGGAGIILEAGGSVTNNAGATISGGSGATGGAGVLIGSGAGEVTNAGTISGGVLFEAGTTNNRLIIKPGAVFNGSADATAATDSTIELTRGGGAISGVGNGNFLGFNTLGIDDGGNWTLNGPNNTIATVLNDGKLEVASDLNVTTEIDQNSTGVFNLDSGSNLEIAAALGANSKMSFDSGSKLVIDNFGLFGENVGTSSYEGSLLKNFGGNGTIDLKDFSAAGISETFSTSGGVLQLQLTNAGMQTATLDFQKSGLGAGAFHFNSDGGNGVLITYS